MTEQNQYTEHPEAEDPSLTVVLGRQRVGKTHSITENIKEYIKDDIETGREGRKVLLLDNNNEYTQLNTIEPTPTNIRKFVNQRTVEARRIILLSKTGMPLSLKEKMEIVQMTIQYFRNGALIYDDLDKYAKHTSDQDMVSMLMGVTHIGCDVITVHQSWRKMSVTECENKRTIKLFSTEDSPDSFSAEKKAAMNMELSHLAHIIVREHFNMANAAYQQRKITKQEWLVQKSYHLYIDYIMERIYPIYNPETYIWALKKYFWSEKRLINDEIDNMIFERILPESRKKDRDAKDLAIERLIEKYKHYFV